MHVTIPYAPRRQFATFHERRERWAVLVVHRRGGKTVAGINDLIRGALTCPLRAPRFAYLAPFRMQAKTVAWDYLKHFSAPLPGGKVSEGELYREFVNGGRVTLFGADNYEALRGIYLDGAVVDEPADMASEVWTDILRPALSDRRGWCVWIGTPKGRNAFFRLYDRASADPEYFTMLMPASTSGILPPEELASARKAMGDDSYAREYECSFNAAVPGSIYGDLIAALRSRSQIQDFERNPDYPLVTSWDLGDSDYCCINLMQFEGRHINLLDYYAGSGNGPGHYAEKCREWESKYGARIAHHYLPHDAENVTHGGSWKRDLTDAGLRNLVVVPRTPDVWLGIHEQRALLPRFYIHKAHCSVPFGPQKLIPSILDCLEFYHKKEVEEGGTLQDKPVHDEFSHGADSLRTFAEAHRQGLLAGTSTIDRETQHTTRKVLRGPGAGAYPNQRKSTVIR